MRVKKNNKNDRDTFVSTKETKMPLYIVRYQIMWVQKDYQKISIVYYLTDIF